MPSFVWNHFTKSIDFKARCQMKGCHRLLSYRTGTKALIYHLEHSHNIVNKPAPKRLAGEPVEEKPQAPVQTPKRQKTLIDYCTNKPTLEKEIARAVANGKPTRSQINRVYSNHESKKPTTKCYVCDVGLGTDRLRILTLTPYSERPIYEIIESFTDVTICHKERKGLAVCTKCFVFLNKFDDLKQQTEEIQNMLTGLFREKSRPEIVYVKEEPEFDCQDELQSFLNVDLDHNEDFHQKLLANSNTVSCSKVSLNEASSSESDNQEDFDSFQDKDEISEETKFTCDLCHKSYRIKSSLELHLATDHGPPGKPLECPICFKTHSNRNTLRHHYRIHATERNLLCVKCGATFIHKHSFKHHMLMHEDVRPFPCEVPGCTKRFRSAAKQKIHLRVHTGEKIFECSFCPGKRYRQKSGLDLHLESHHKDQIKQPVKCKFCGIKIESSSKLQLHLERVHQILGMYE